jgi:hypothetical protein
MSTDHFQTKVKLQILHTNMYVLNRQSSLTEAKLCRGADKSLAFPISPTSGLQHNQNSFSWMG